MPMQIVTFNDELMQDGKFYLVAVNKDQANAILILPDPVQSEIHFLNASYIREPYISPYSVEIWKVEKYGLEEKHINITHSVNWYIEKPSNHIVIHANTPISGYIKYIKFI